MTHEVVLPSVKLGMYRHSKSGRMYEVVGTALHTETDEVLVIYKPLDRNESASYARPYAMFTEKVLLNGISVPRFEKIND